MLITEKKDIYLVYNLEHLCLKQFINCCLLGSTVTIRILVCLFVFFVFVLVCVFFCLSASCFSLLLEVSSRDNPGRCSCRLRCPSSQGWSLLTAPTRCSSLKLITDWGEKEQAVSKFLHVQRSTSVLCLPAFHAKSSLQN